MRRSKLPCGGIINVNIILIGAQGSGKGTQAELLAQTFDLQQVASGDLFRKAFEEQRELPERVP